MFKADSDGHNAEKVYLLNKALHAVELFYADKLPDIWGAEHPLGSVMGRAKYGDHLFFYQGCTVGGSWVGNKLLYPTLGEYVTMFSNSKILGNSHIGNHVVLAANAYVINCDIPDYSYVYPSIDGRNPLIIKSNKDKIAQREMNFWQ